MGAWPMGGVSNRDVMGCRFTNSIIENSLASPRCPGKAPFSAQPHKVVVQVTSEKCQGSCIKLGCKLGSAARHDAGTDMADISTAYSPAKSVLDLLTSGANPGLYRRYI